MHVGKNNDGEFVITMSVFEISRIAYELTCRQQTDYDRIVQDFLNKAEETYNG